MTIHRFSVRGVAVTQGSKVAGVNRATGFAFMREVNGAKLGDWRQAIADAARTHVGPGVITGPVKATLTFSLRRPKKLPTRLPTGQRSGDVDKLARAALDAMTGVVYLDDSQVVSLLVSKCWAEVGTAPGVDVLVEEMA